MPMITARQKVLAYLRKKHAVSAAQIGRALNMSAATVRHHLSVLCSDGRAAEVGAARKEGRGRPMKLYGLSENLMGNNLALLLDLFLSEGLEGLSPARREEVLGVLAEGLINRMGQTGLEVPMAKRLALVIEELNRLNYQARWEAGAEGPRILFGHCPYAAIIGKHPELCRMDAAMLEKTMRQSARQVAKIGAEGSTVCVFQTS